MSAGAKKRVIVGMSGGVDSSVAALLLLEQGYTVEGLFMANWEDDDEDTYCTAAQDFQDARQVCETLGIPLHRVSFVKEYRERVFRYFLEEYAAGRTPNPDVLCNSEIKFKAFLNYALRLGADHIATGHYARLKMADGKPHLFKALDTDKDQSYFLHAVPGAALAQAIFPLGELNKREVREIAKQAGFDNFRKKDSTGICFIGERRFREFLAKYLPAQPGEIQTPESKLVGQHQGLMYYTLGQRQGLGIGGLADASEAAWYVVDKDIEHNVLIVGQDHNHPRLMHDALLACQLAWVAGEAPPFPSDLMAKTRYRQVDQACRVEWQDDTPESGLCRVEFAEPQRAITPGQYVVFYHGDECLGGGVIEQAFNRRHAAGVSRREVTV